MKTRIHVNQHHIRSNKTKGTNLPVITVKQGTKNTYCNEVEILGPSKVVYGGDGCDAKPLLSQNMSTILNIQEQTQHHIFINMKHILYFYKNGCGPCDEVKPLIDKLSESNKIDRININERDTIADKLNIMYTPTIAVIDSETKSMVKYEGSKKIKQVINENLI